MGDLDNIFSRPRPSLSRLGRPCAVLKVRAQSWLCPPLRSKLTLPSFADAVSFFCSCNPTSLARNSKLRPIKITHFFVTGTGYGKVKKEGNFWLLRKIRKECAPQFTTLADYSIPRNKSYTFVSSRWRYPWRLPASSTATSWLRSGHLLCHPRSGTRCSSSIICEDQDSCVCNCYSLPAWFNRMSTVNCRL